MASIKMIRETALLFILALILSVPIITVALNLLAPDLQLWKSLWRTLLPDYISNTLLLMVTVGVLSALIGVLCAWFVTAYDFPGRKYLSWALILPIVAPPYIIAYVYADILEFYGPVQTSLRSIFGWAHGDYWFPAIRNIPGAALILSLVLYPYVYILARASFLGQNQSQLWAARSLGLSPKSTFIKIALPAARPAIAGGLALVLMEVLADFGVADFFSIPTFSVGIFRNWLILGDKPTAMNLASVMLMAVIILVIFEAGSRKGQRGQIGQTTAQAEPIKPAPLTGFMMTVFCLIPLCLGLIVPLMRLLYHSAFTGDAHTGANLFTYVKNSLTLALIVAVIVAILALFLAYHNMRKTSRTKTAFIRIATLGYALPGALLAVGLLAPLSWLDQSLAAWLSSISAWSGGLILTGSIIALVYALCVRFITVGFNAIDAGFTAIPPSMDAAARSLGAGSARRAREIMLPLLRPSLIAAIILVFIDVLRELPATLILRPFNFDTLATRVYWLASDERLAEASSASLIIILIGLIPTFYINRQIIKTSAKP